MTTTPNDVTKMKSILDARRGPTPFAPVVETGALPHDDRSTPTLTDYDSLLAAVRELRPPTLWAEAARLCRPPRSMERDILS
jgi:hypothetical protein